MSRSVSNKHLARFLLNLNSNIIKPSLKAYVFAYLYVTIPKIINRVVSLVKKNDISSIPSRVLKILIKALHPHKFPAFAASLIAIINVLEPFVAKGLRKTRVFKNPMKILFFATFISSFIGSSLTFKRFQNHILDYGRFLSLDLTLLVFSRAVDTTLSSTLTAVLPPFLQQFGDGLLFIASCTPIMYSWFYRPQSLPPAYRNWITSAANMDDEFVAILKGIHDGTVEYGVHTNFLDDYCKKYGRDPKLGDVGEHIPLPCETVHAFQTKNCEAHALWRFARGFYFAIKLYGGINALMLLFPKKNVTMVLRIRRALESSVRSSAFLGAFIGLYWYAVCLVRTRLGPILFPKVPKHHWDKTIAPSAGAFLCGFSSFVESAQRRKELALFVFPRAIGTFIPTEASEKNLFLERLTFSVSMAVLVAYCKRRPDSVRGIFGKGLKSVMSIEKY